MTKLQEAIQRTLNMAMLHGTGFMKMTYEAETNSFLIVSILPEFITVSYEKDAAHD